jgi:hypothetical protein
MNVAGSITSARKHIARSAIGVRVAQLVAPNGAFVASGLQSAAAALDSADNS